MTVEGSVEHRTSYDEATDDEHDSFLPRYAPPSQLSLSCSYCEKIKHGTSILVLAFLAGIITSLITQHALFPRQCSTVATKDRIDYPLPTANLSILFSATPNVNTLFPSEVGYAGGTSTGIEAAMVMTAPAYPLHTGAAELLVPQKLAGGNGPPSPGFDLLRQWGNLSPWYSVDGGAFGLPDASPEPPTTCHVIGLHLLYRHGSRYPTASSYHGGPAGFAKRLKKSQGKWNAKRSIAFLNDWTYKLGEEILTPFGRQQMYDLGVSMRLKYGFLLKNFTESHTKPVFRTESQDRMLMSGYNFALGFFGHPILNQYHSSIMIEAPGFNNTLAPYYGCTNAGDKSKGKRGKWYVERWTAIYHKDALARLQSEIEGYKLSIEDLYAMQQLCAYETVALGYSKFCEVFTEEEWQGFNYAIDLDLWYKSSFGSPVARAQGIGWVRELVARVTHLPIETHDSLTNSTLDNNPVTFPLNQSLYADATHEVVVLNVLTALNVTTLAQTGHLPFDHIPLNRSFRASELVPFATNVQFQLLDCISPPGSHIRIVINDGVTRLTGIKGCPEQKDGMCPLHTFISAQRERIGEVDWQYECQGKWEVPEGDAWTTKAGAPPERS